MMENRSKSKILAIYAFSMFSIHSITVNAQTIPAVPALSNVVQLSAQGSIEVQQDTLTISLSTTRESPDSSSLQIQLKAALESALAEAKKAVNGNGMAVRTGQFNVSPRYDKNGKINGWQGNVELILEGSDFERIASTAGKIQTLTVSNVSFGLSRDQRIVAESKAQAIAINRFKFKASEISNSFGFSTYTLREVVISAADQAFTPRPRVMAMDIRMASVESTVPVEAGKNTVVVNVSGSIQLN
ncbi:MAG TPA: SIMPL domain-containing protein [Burkholderiaceae bacterium]|nr:SIMPL domain-containing protein [Burkholderiaceae bacterium]